MEQKVKIITKGTYQHGGAEELISLKQYMFIRGENKKKQLVLRFVNEHVDACQKYSFYLYLLNARGDVIHQELYERENVSLTPGKTFVFDEKIDVPEKCTDFRVVLAEASFGNYIYRVKNAGVLVTYKNARELNHDVVGKYAKAKRKRRFRILKKPLLCAAVALVMLACVFAMAAFIMREYVDTHNDFSLSGVQYEFVASKDGTQQVDIIGYKGLSGNVLLPSSIEGYPVRAIREGAFKDNRLVRHVRIENMDVPKEAFSGCSNLKSVELVNVETIGKQAFYNCDVLESFSSDCIETIEAYAFAECDALASVVITDMEGDRYLNVGEYAFSNCQGLTDVRIDRWIDYPDDIAIFNNDTQMLRLSLRNYACTIPGVVPAHPAATTLGAIFGRASDMSVLALQEVSVKYMDQIPSGFCEDMGALRRFVVPTAEWTTIPSNAFAGCKFLTEISLVNPIKRVESKGLYNTGFTYFPGAELEYIGDSAFENCTNLLSIGVPQDGPLTHLGVRALAGCTSMTSFVIPAGINIPPEYLFAGCTALNYVEFAPNCDATTLPKGLFSDCSSLMGIKLPDNLRIIGESAFAGCSSLKTIPYAPELTEIGKYAFERCGFETLVIPENISYVRFGAFRDCNSLQSVTLRYLGEYAASLTNNYFGYIFGLEINAEENVVTGTVPASITTINLNSEYTELKNYSFYGCTGLTHFDFPAGFKKIGAYAFGGCTGLTELPLPATVQNIEDYAFANCTGLVSFTVPSNIGALADGVFSGCTSLSDIHFPSTMGHIGDSTFAGCTALQFVNLPNALINIGDFAFADCTSLLSLSLGGNAKTIGASAFSGCTAMNTVALPVGLTSIGERAFANTAITSLIIPKTVTQVGVGVLSGCQALAELTLSFVGAEGEGGGKFIGALFGCLNDEIPASLKKLSVVSNGSVNIEVGAFSDILYIEQIELGAGVVAIHTGAFVNCPRLFRISLPATLSVLEDGSFSNCRRLYEVSDASGITQTNDGGLRDYAIEIKGDATPAPAPIVTAGVFRFALYSGEWYLIDYNETVAAQILPSGVTYEGSPVYFRIPARFFEGNQTLTSIVLPTGALEIGEHAFSGCINLASVTLGNSVHTIGDAAFYGCESLSNIKLSADLGTIGENAFAYCTNLYDVFYNGPVLSLEIGSDRNGGVAKYAVVIHSNMNDTLSTQVSLLNGTMVARKWQGHVLILSYNGSYEVLDLSTLTSDLEKLYITEGLFQGNSYLKKVVLGSQVMQIRDAAFAYCTALDTVVMQDNGVATLGAGAFEGCSNLTVATLSNSITKIDMYAFSGCNLLESVNLPTSLHVIGEGAFENCTRLLSVTLPQRLVSIGSNAYANCTHLYEVINLSGMSIVRGSSSNGAVAQHAKGVFTSANGGLERYEANGCLFVLAPDEQRWYLYATPATVNGHLLMIPEIGDNLPMTATYAAFRNTSYSAMVLPCEMDTFEDGAFYMVYCPETIYYTGTKMQWYENPLSSYSYGVFNVYYYADCVHEDGYWTYTEDGVTLSFCMLVVTRVEATCFAEGTETHTCACAGCKHKEVYSIPQLTHDFVNDICVHCGGEQIFVDESNFASEELAEIIINDETVPFTVSGDVISSANHEDSTSSTLQIKMNGLKRLYVRFRIGTSCEIYDTFTVTHMTADGEEVHWQGDYSGTESDYLTFELAENDTITFVFQKDESQSAEDDIGYIQNLYFMVWAE